MTRTFATLFAIVAMLVPLTASAVAPTFLRTPSANTLPYEEMSMTAPVGECSGYSACLAIGNWSPTWLAVDILEWGTSNASTNRVFTEAVFTGIYLDADPVTMDRGDGLPQTVFVTLDNQQIEVPVLYGNFVSALSPCKAEGAYPMGYMRVSPSIRNVTIQAHTLVVTGDDRSPQLAFDANKGVLVRAPFTAHGTLSGVFTAKKTLYDANGTPVSVGKVLMGPGQCRR